MRDSQRIRFDRHPDFPGHCHFHQFIRLQYGQHVQSDF